MFSAGSLVGQLLIVLLHAARERLGGMFDCLDDLVVLLRDYGQAGAKMFNGLIVLGVDQTALNTQYPAEPAFFLWIIFLKLTA